MAEYIENLRKAAFQRVPILQKVPRWGWWLSALAFLLLVVIWARSMPMNSGKQNLSALDTTSLGLDVLLKLGIIVLLIYTGSNLLNKWRSSSARRSNRKMVILETTRLSTRQHIHLVQVGDQVLLIGATDQTVTCLAEIDGETLLPEPNTRQVQPTVQPGQGLPVIGARKSQWSTTKADFPSLLEQKTATSDQG